MIGLATADRKLSASAAKAAPDAESVKSKSALRALPDMLVESVRSGRCAECAAGVIKMASFFKRLLRREPTPAHIDETDPQVRRADAAAKLRELAERGDPAAQLDLAQMYQRGYGVQPDVLEAERWFLAAAEAGSVAAQARLGALYLTGAAAAGSETPAALPQLDAGSTPEALLAQLFPEPLAIAQEPEQAAQWNARAARAGDAGAQARLAHQYASGFGVARDVALAEHWFAAAAAQQHLAGHLGLGLLYAGGYGGKPEHARALEWFLHCMAWDNATAQLCLALLLLYGEGVAHDEVRALALLEHAAAANHPAAMFHLGELYGRGRCVTRDTSQAESWLRCAAKRGYIKASLALAQLLRSDPDADETAAATICREAAELGDGEAQYLMGQLLLAGEGVARDPVEAAGWLAKAADQNVTGAYEMHGAPYTEGAGCAGLAQDFQAAADWFHRAAAHGESSGLYQVGTLQFGGLAMPRDPPAVGKWYEQAATRGSGAACLALGILCATGKHVEQDYAEAARWLALAAAHGVALGNYQLAGLYFRGLGVPEDPEQGLALLVAAAEADCVDAAWTLHYLYSAGEYVARDAQAATRWLLRAAKLGSSKAVCQLAQRFRQADPLAPQVACVIEMLERCAADGHADAQAKLGLAYLRGKQLPENLPLAVEWITRAAQGGHAMAQALLGDFLVLGRGVAVDLEAATGWYERAALQGHAGAITALVSLRMAGGTRGAGGGEKTQVFQLWLTAAQQGHAVAQRMVGQFYLRGVGTTISPEEGHRWLAAAARQGHAGAMVLLGGLLLQQAQQSTGQADADDQAHAAELFRRAAVKGSIDAQYNLGVCLRHGLGVRRDDAKAERLYAAAAQHGHLLAQQALRVLQAQYAEEPEPGPETGPETVPERRQLAFESG